MTRVPYLVIAAALLNFVAITGANGQQVDSGTGQGAGWSVSVPGAGSVVLAPEATATVSEGCSGSTCEDHASAEVVEVKFPADSPTPTASADVLRAEADAHRDAGATATMQAVMAAASGITLPTLWNTRGYGRAEGFSALNGAILANTIESESVSGTRVNGSEDTVSVSASGARVVNLRLTGTLSGETLAPILPGQVNQVLLNAAGIQIIFWETNWSPATGTTTDGQPVWVNALHIIDTPSGIDIKVGQSNARSTFTTPAPTPSPTGEPSQSPSAEPSQSPAAEPTAEPSESPSASASPDPSTSTDPSPPLSSTAHPPVANDDVATSTGSPVTTDVLDNDTDQDGDLDPTTLRVVTDPTNGVASCTEGRCIYGPVPGFIGIDWFVYEICDLTERCDTAAVMIIVTASLTDGGDGTVSPPGDGTGGIPGEGIGNPPDGLGGGGGNGGGGNGGGGNGSDPGENSGGTDSDPPSGGFPVGGDQDPTFGGPRSKGPETGTPSRGGPRWGRPLLGAPQGPPLPFTGATHIAFYLALVMNLLGLGALVLLACRSANG